MTVRWISMIFLVLMLFTVNSCRKEEHDENNVLTYNYRIWLDQLNRFVKMTCSIGNSEFFTISYEYYDTIIVEKKTNAYMNLSRTSTYYLNDLGRADSCYNIENYGIQGMKYFSYTADGYLESDGWNHYEYAGGNRVKAPDPSYGGSFSYVGHTYEYTDLQNVIDIDEFKGSYLGKINKNLMSRNLYKGLHGGDFYFIEYSYTLNENNYVIQRVALRSEPAEKETSNFKYIIVK